VAVLTEAARAAIDAGIRDIGFALEVRDAADSYLGTLGLADFAGLVVDPASVNLSRSWGQATTGELSCQILAESDDIIDFDAVRIAPVATLAGEIYELGRYLPFRPNRSYSAAGVRYELRAPDLGLLLGMQFSRSGLLSVGGSDDDGNGFAAGTSVIAAVERIARMTGVTSTAIADPLAILASDRAWAIGQVTAAQAITELLAAVSYRPLRFDGQGRLVSRRAERLEDQPAVWTYRDGAGPLRIEERPEQIANIAIVLCEDPNREPFGVRFINDSPESPDSVVNVPIRRVLPVKDNTIVGVSEALERARTALEERSRAARSASLTIPPNPALEPLDVIEVEIGAHSGRWRLDEITWHWGGDMSLKLSDASAAIAQSDQAND